MCILEKSPGELRRCFPFFLVFTLFFFGFLSPAYAQCFFNEHYDFLCQGGGLDIAAPPMTAVPPSDGQPRNVTLYVEGTRGNYQEALRQVRDGMQSCDCGTPAEEEAAAARLIKLREGTRRCRDDTTMHCAYIDTRGVRTIGHGRGHWTGADRITNAEADQLFDQDLATYLSAARSQASQVGICNTQFIAALASVNYQLGTGWYREHRRTWTFIQQGNYTEAANEAARSSWYGQTPVRVHDFQAALRGLAAC